MKKVRNKYKLYKSFSTTLTFALSVYAALMILNLIGSMAYFAGTVDNNITDNKSAVGFILAFIYLIVLTPCSYLCWFRPLYKAFR